MNAELFLRTPNSRLRLPAEAHGAKAGTALAVLLIIAISLAVYGSTLTHSFVYDDYSVVRDSPLIRQWSNLRGLFNSDYFHMSGEMSYRPVVTLTYFIDYFLWKLRPPGYHLTNLLLHTLNGVLLYFLIRLLLKRPAVALVSALLFCVHPVTTEAVNAVSFREDLLTLSFCLLAFLAYLKGPVPALPRSRDFILCLVFFSLALFSKEMALIAPLLFLLSEFCFSKDFLPTVKSRLPLYAGLFIVLGFYLLVRFFLLRNPYQPTFPAPPFHLRMLSMSTAVFFYLKLLLLPLKLSAEHIYPLANSIREPGVFFSIIGLVLILLFSIVNLRRLPELIFGIWWFFLALLPVVNIVPLYNPVAERYLYLPLVGFCLVMAVVAEAVFLRLKSPAKYLPPGILILLLFFYSFRTVRRNRDWKDYFTFALKTVESCPGSARFHNNLGFAYEIRGQIDQAIREYLIAIRMQPDFVAAYNNLGCAYGEKELLEEAIRVFQEALKIDPYYAKLHNNLGLSYRKKGLLEEAIREFQEALKINPNYVKAHNNLGLAYESRGRLVEAIGEFQAALGIDPDNADLHHNLGTVLSKKGENARAIEHWKKALALDPTMQEPKDNLIRMKRLGYW